jgi:hypothetical protein
VKERNEWIVVVAVGVCYSYKYRVTTIVVLFLHSCYNNHSHPFALFLLLFPSSGSRTTITTKSKTTKLTTCLIGICWPQPLLRFGLYISKRILYNEFLYIFFNYIMFYVKFQNLGHGRIRQHVNPFQSFFLCMFLYQSLIFYPYSL